MPTVNFIPNRDGFHFANSFTNVVNLGLGKITTNGRCGGMAYASLDYRAAGLPIPTCMSAAAVNSKADDFSSNPNDDPPDGTALADYIYSRLFDSFLAAGPQTVQWFLGSDHSTDFGPGTIGWSGVVPMTKTQQWPALQQAINAGNPVVITMITTSGNLGDCHQVVAYGYTVEGNAISVLLYDNNFPDDNTVMISSTVDGTNPHWNESNSVGSATDIWRGWFIETGYGPKTPPFADIHMASAISVSSPLSGMGMNKQKLTASYSITNAGPYPAHFQALQLLITDSTGTSYPGVIPVELNTVTIQPGQTAQFSANTASLDLTPGNYMLTAQYQTLEGYWTNVVSGNGIANTFNLQVLAGLAVSLSVTNPTPATRGVAGGLQAGYNVSLSGQASGFTGPINWNWTIDSGSASQQAANGQNTTVFVPIGNKGGPFQYSHTIELTATSGAETASASYELNLAQPSGSLLMDDSHSVVGTTQRVPPPPGLVTISYEIYTAWQKIAVAASTSALYAPVTYTWNGGGAQQVQSLNSGAEEVFQMPLKGAANQLSSYTSNLQVSLVATDQVGQKVSLNGVFPVLTVTRIMAANSSGTGTVPSATGSQQSGQGGDLGLLESGGKGSSSTRQAVVSRQPAPAKPAE